MLGMSSTSPTSSSRLSQRGGPDAVAAAGRRGSIPTKALQVLPARDALPPALSSLTLPRAFPLRRCSARRSTTSASRRPCWSW